MEYQNLLIENRDNILIVTLNRPQALNALNKQTMSELQYLFVKDAIQRSEIKGIILTGAGDKSFVAGADIKEFLSMESGQELGKKGHDILFAIENFHKPTIAAVNGFALGGGCEIAMACHMRVASEKAKFGQPEVNLGILPGYGGTQRLTKLIGRGMAMELIMTGDMISAQEAYRIGLVNHVVNHGEEVSKSIEIINKIAGKAPLAIAKSIACINACEAGNSGYQAELDAFEYLTKTNDFREGATAFVEKRKANFTTS